MHIIKHYEHNAVRTCMT